jgi:hypothetical protein
VHRGKAALRAGAPGVWAAESSPHAQRRLAPGRSNR